ncbi:MAG: phosphohydrolase [Betaproteobacteria bacterium RIFCSPLOWO2_12_FULL_62_13]|nr:MAG: phosphohydrolase [Betaproteobacteria bacterium RIFCSPLOWO2_12_FULL_62_13]
MPPFAPESSPLFSHEDPLSLLNTSAPLERKLAAIHEDLVQLVEVVDRIAIATYDRDTDLLKTFISSGPRTALVYYDAKLAESPSLAQIVAVGRPRVVNDLEIFRKGPGVHAKVIRDTGFRSSYTMPMYQNGVFWGFIFFNSLQRNVFGPERLQILDVYGHFISALVTGELLAVRVLAAAVRTVHDMVHYRDPETGAHIDRMARYARLIARHLGAAGIHPIDDRRIERILEFAPLHDIGKIGIPDRILLKPGRLTSEEREEMKQHTTRGLQMIDAFARNFGFEHLEGLDILRHIAESHHETMDGSGYPRGLKGAEIPLEARIVAVADIFDALTSERPYKHAWSNEEAFGLLRKLSRDTLDADCVEALLRNRKEVLEIQRRFQDEPKPPPA